jgi:hypothetical protein
LKPRFQPWQHVKSSGFTLTAHAGPLGLWLAARLVPAYCQLKNNEKSWGLAKIFGA